MDIPSYSSIFCSRNAVSELEYLSLELLTSVRLANRASASSKKRITSALEAASKIMDRFFSVSPMYLEKIREMSTR